MPTCPPIWPRTEAGRSFARWGSSASTSALARSVCPGERKAAPSGSWCRRRRPTRTRSTSPTIAGSTSGTRPPPDPPREWAGPSPPTDYSMTITRPRPSFGVYRSLIATSGQRKATPPRRDARSSNSHRARRKHHHGRRGRRGAWRGPSLLKPRGGPPCKQVREPCADTVWELGGALFQKRGDALAGVR